MQVLCQLFPICYLFSLAFSVVLLRITLNSDREGALAISVPSEGRGCRGRDEVALSLRLTLRQLRSYIKNLGLLLDISILKAKEG